MKTKVSFAILFFLTTLFSQSSELHTSLGISAGLLTGSGLSYRNIGESKGLQFTFGIMSFPYEEYDDGYWSEERSGLYDSNYWVPDTSEIFKDYEYGNGGTWGNAGLVFIKPLHRAKRSTFYVLTGVSMYYSSSVDYYTEYKYILTSDSTYSYNPISDRVKDSETNYTFRVGFGIGIEYQFTENIRLSLDMPLTISDNRRITMIVPEAGIYYYFK